MKYRHKDSRDRLIADGDIVAYNLSGRVARGEVVRQTRSAIHILTIDGGGYYTQNPYAVPHLSKVKHGTSVMVLKEGDHSA